MIQTIARRIFGTQNERELKTVYPIIERINSLEAALKPLSDEALRAKTADFKERISRGETLDQVLPEAFAVVREAGLRVLGQRHYDVQMIGGIILHRGRIAEMRTGEGKTLVSTLPAYLNALAGKGVHVVTVNDYLARRDAEWMGKLHRFLGLEVGIIVHGLSDFQRKQNYGCDITYGTNSEFGFDYLRDNMKFSLADYVQRDLNYAIVDEVDSILIDEARTPLIISGPTGDATEKYYTIDRIIPKLSKEVDYTLDEKARSASLTEEGVNKVEKSLNVNNLYEPQNIELVHHVNQALKAHVVFKRDVDYVVKEGEVLIVDEFTGRVMPGRRWSDGLHQAIEAKEGVEIENENQTLATITYQNFFRMYSKLSGMTGTADTEATEFKKIYNLDVVIIPTNKPMVRKDAADVVYKNANAKYNAMVQDVKAVHELGQPILVGTVSVEKSEVLSNLLKKERIPHSVLNAKQHDREAEIVAQAGRKKSVTIATNMAGRGTDILLGGNAEFLAKQELGKKEFASEEEKNAAYEKFLKDAKAQCAREHQEVKDLGGLLIIGTERHESRRIDNQLRGRAGRQGDPGASRFYLSLEDDLMRVFGSANVARFMEDEVPIEHRWITRAIENAQKKVEAHNFDIRKHLLEYDDVMNQQRKVIYGLRREILKGENLKGLVLSMGEEVAIGIADEFYPKKRAASRDGQGGWDLEGLNHTIKTAFHIESHFSEKDLHGFHSVNDLSKAIITLVENSFESKEKQLTPEVMQDFVQMVLLTTIDHHWKDHLLAMDHLRDGIGLRGYGQKDPLLEYKKEGYNYFTTMYNVVNNDAVRRIFEIQVQREEQIEQMAPKAQPMTLTHGGVPEGALPIGDKAIEEVENIALAGASRAARESKASGQTSTVIPGGVAGGGVSNIGRNDPCPCGSGKKFKKCHGGT